MKKVRELVESEPITHIIGFLGGGGEEIAMGNDTAIQNLISEKYR